VSLLVAVIVVDRCCYVSVYKSPKYESMGFRLVVNRLVAIGYPEAIREFEYDHSFPVRSVCLSVCLSACISLCLSVSVWFISFIYFFT